MLGIRSMVLSSILLASSICVTAGVPVLPNAAMFLGSGADILLVNPRDLGDVSAWRNRIFSISFSQNQTTPGLPSYLVPDNTSALMYPECEFGSEVTLLTSEFDFQSMIDIKIKTFFRFLFWTSTKTTEYNEFAEYFSKHQTYSYEATAECSMYTLEFQEYSDHALDPDFHKTVLALPIDHTGCGLLNHNESSCVIWNQFLADYGTHVVNQVDMGGHAKMSLHINSGFYQQTQSGNMNPQELAKIKFQKALNQDTHGGDLTPDYKMFDGNTTTFNFGCEGGDPGFCEQSNISFANWSASVPKNPLPKKVSLQRLNELITTDNFPELSASDVSSLAATMKKAIDWYLLKEGKIPFAYQADVAHMYDHDISLGHRSAGLPSMVFLGFSDQPRGNTTETYAVGPSFHLCQTSPAAAPASCTTQTWANPSAISASTTNVAVGVSTTDANLRMVYDSETQTWTAKPVGYWLLHATSGAPTFDSGWTMDSAGASHVTSLSSKTGAISSTTAFMQVSFAAEEDPEEAFPLIWRFDNTSNPNPVTIQLTNGTVALHVNASDALFGQNNAHGTPTNYKTGFWRAVAFDPPANNSGFYDSDWFALDQQSSGALDLFKDLAHGLGCTPELVQVWFSSSGSMDSAFPVTFLYQGSQRGNPATVRVDEGNIVLHFILHPNNVIFSAWDATSGAWSEFKVGEPLHWRVTALARISDLDGQTAP